MAKMRRRRKAVTWLGTNATVVAAEGNQLEFEKTSFTVSFQFLETVDIAHVITPLVPHDEPVEPADVATLSDVIGNEYIVERIVGNCYAHVYQSAAGAGASTTPTVLLCAGVFVARADGENPDLPIGASGTGSGTSTDESSRNYNPLDNETQREPWMFRRTWMLNALKEVSPADGTFDWGGGVQITRRRYPNTTCDYHGLRTGPFFDIKSKRRIRQDERLWLVTAAHLCPHLAGEGVGTYNVEATYDVRILGALRRARNKSNF